MAIGFVSKAQSNKEKETREKETINPQLMNQTRAFGNLVLNQKGANYGMRIV